MTFAHNVLPALLFGALGIGSVAWTVHLWRQWSRDSAIRGVGFGWAPLGGWQPLASLFADDRDVRETTNVVAVYLWLLFYAVMAAAAFAGAYQYLRTGHGFGN